MVCDVPLLRSSPSLGKVLQENQSKLYIDPQLLGSWEVMFLINGIARADSPCVLVPPSLAPEERTHCGRAAPVNVACAKCVLMVKEFRAFSCFFFNVSDPEVRSKIRCSYICNRNSTNVLHMHYKTL